MIITMIITRIITIMITMTIRPKPRQAMPQEVGARYTDIST